jgi:hypothetical protein
VELACAADVLMGGMCGARGASIAEKADIFKRVWEATHSSFRLKGKLRTATDLPTTEPLGFPQMTGITRRPDFGQWPGMAVTIAAIIKYAKSEPDGLKTRLPRVTWLKHEWSPSVVGCIMRDLLPKRKEMDANGECPDMAQRNLRLKKGTRTDPPPATSPGSASASGTGEESRGDDGHDDSDRGTTTNGADAPAIGGNDDVRTNNGVATASASFYRRSTRKRQGPCAFGCGTTTNVRNGVQIWKALPRPCPWPSLPLDSVLCNKCYSKGNDFENDKR